MFEKFLFCDSCAVVVVNCDDSHIWDADERDRVAASIEAAGMVADTGEQWQGYGRCFGCGWDVIDPRIFESCTEEV